MDSVKPIKIYLSLAVMVFVVVISASSSISSYIAYFLKEDLVKFSFDTAVIIWMLPLLVRMIYFILIVGCLKRKVSLNNKITNVCVVVGFIGFFFSFFYSFYVEYDLTSQGYVKCYKKSSHSRTKYVISKDMCK